MAQNENVATIENAVAQMNEGNVDGYLELYSDDLTVHGYPPGVEGKAGVTEFYRSFRKAISDFELTIVRKAKRQDGDAQMKSSVHCLPSFPAVTLQS